MPLHSHASLPLTLAQTHASSSTLSTLTHHSPSQSHTNLLRYHTSFTHPLHSHSSLTLSLSHRPSPWSRLFHSPFPFSLSLHSQAPSPVLSGVIFFSQTHFWSTFLVVFLIVWSTWFDFFFFCFCFCFCCCCCCCCCRCRFLLFRWISRGLGFVFHNYDCFDCWVYYFRTFFCLLLSERMECCSWSIE